MSYSRESIKREKRKTDLLKDAISKDETRLYLNSFWHDSAMKGLCATNGHVATVLCSRYSEELKDILICPKTFKVIHRDKVKIQAVIPTAFKHEIQFTIKETHYFKQKVRSKPTRAHFYLDGSISIEDINAEKELLFSVNSSFLRYLVGGTYTIGVNTDLSPVVVALDDGNLHGDIYIMMPLKV